MPFLPESWCRWPRRVALGAALAWPGLAAAQDPPNRLSWSLRLQQSGSDDPRFLTEEAPTAASAFVVGAGTSIGFSHRGERSRFTLSGRTSGRLFRDLDEFSGLTYGAGMGWQYEVSPHTRLRVNQSYSSGVALATASSLGLLPGRRNARSLQSSVGLSRKMSLRTSLTTSVSYNRTSFDLDEPVEASRFVLEPTDAAAPVVGGLVGTEPDGGVAPPDAERFLLDVLATEGLTDSRVTSQFVGGSLGVAHQLSLRTSASFSFNAGFRSFDSDRPREGAQLGGSLRFNRLATAKDMLFAGYTVRSNLSQTPSVTTHTLLGGWSRSLRARRPQLDMSLSGGLSYFSVGEGRGSRYALTTRAGLTARATEGTSLNARYSRRFIETLGFGRNLLTDTLTLGIGQRISDRVQVSGFAGYSRGRDPLEDGTSLSSQRYGARLSVRLVETLSLGASYSRNDTAQARAGQRAGGAHSLWSFFLLYRDDWP